MWYIPHSDFGFCLQSSAMCIHVTSSTCRERTQNSIFVVCCRFFLNFFLFRCHGSGGVAPPTLMTLPSKNHALSACLERLNLTSLSTRACCEGAVGCMANWWHLPVGYVGAVILGRDRSAKLECNECLEYWPSRGSRRYLRSCKAGGARESGRMSFPLQSQIPGLQLSWKTNSLCMGFSPRRLWVVWSPLAQRIPFVNTKAREHLAGISCFGHHWGSFCLRARICFRVLLKILCWKWSVLLFVINILLVHIS